MPRPVRLILIAIPTVLILATLGVWGYRTLGSKPIEPVIAVGVKTQTVAGIAFEVEFNDDMNLLTTGGPDAVRFRRGNDVLDFDTGIIAINAVAMPDVKAGDVVRWNLTGPLLVNDRPVQPHPLQARLIDAQHIDALWEARESPSPRDTFTVAWAGTSRLLVVAHGDGAIRVWDVDRGEICKTMIPDPPKGNRAGYGLRAAVSPDGQTIAAANIFGEEVTIWDLATGNKTATFSEPKGKVAAIGFPTSGSLIEVRAGELFIRNLAGDRSAASQGKVPEQFHAPFDFAGNMLATTDGKVLSISERRFEKSNGVTILGTPVRSFTLPRAHVGINPVLALSSDGRLLAAFDGDSRLAIFDTKAGEVVRRLHWRGKLGAANSINALAFSTDGKTLAVGDDSTIRLYDVPTGRERGELATEWVRSLAYSADGRTLAAGMRRLPSVRLWETADLVAK